VAKFTESVVEDAALSWLEELGYAVPHGPEIAPGESAAERDGLDDVVMKPGDRVKTMRGTPRGVIVRKLDDGRLLGLVDGSGAELISLPEGLIPERAQ
jgi:hypothetical protein